MQTESKTYGPLTCRTVDFLKDGESPEWMVVLCHGFGAPGTDLVSLAAGIFSLKPELQEKKIRFLFPEAPVSLAEMGYGEGRAWWMIDMLALQVAMQSGEFREFRSGEPEGMPEAREKLLATLQEVMSESGLGWDRVVLGGFSQGSMITTDITLRLDESPAGLVVYSGTLLNEEVWKEFAPKRAGLKVIQSHGRMDPILPYLGAEALRDLLTEAGLEVEFQPFNSVHTISHDGLASLVTMLMQLTEN